MTSILNEVERAALLTKRTKIIEQGIARQQKKIGDKEKLPLTRIEILYIAAKRGTKDSNGNYITDDKIAEELGICRQSLWKWIRRLKEAGYKINHAPVGKRRLGLENAQV